jgi:hypothetical protein
MSSRFGGGGNEFLKTAAAAAEATRGRRLLTKNREDEGHVLAVWRRRKRVLGRDGGSGEARHHAFFAIEGPESAFLGFVYSFVMGFSNNKHRANTCVQCFLASTNHAYFPKKPPLQWQKRPFCFWLNF